MSRMISQSTKTALKSRVEDAQNILEKSSALMNDEGRLYGSDSNEPRLRLAHKIQDLAMCTIDLAKILSDDCIDDKPINSKNLMSSEAAKLVNQVFNESSDLGEDDISLDAENAAGLRHILESYRDHLGSGSPPNMKFRFGQYRNDLRSVYCDYTVNDRIITSDYFCIDNIYFDIFQPSSEEMVSRLGIYGKNWMYICFTVEGFKEFRYKLYDDAYWEMPHDFGFQRREKQNLRSFPVLLDENNPPSWKVMVPRNRFRDDSIEIVNHGRLDTILNNPSMNGLYRGTGIFRLACSAKTELTNITDFRMQLVGVRIFKKEDYFRNMENKVVHSI